MATTTVTQTDSNQGNTAVISGTVGNADTSQVFQAVPSQQAFFILQGTIGTGVTVVVEASYDGGVTFQTLKDNNNAAMSYSALTTNPIPLTLPAGAAIRVRSSGGSGVTLAWFIGFAKSFI